jgi:hypothetical protein
MLIGSMFKSASKLADNVKKTVQKTVDMTVKKVVSTAAKVVATTKEKVTQAVKTAVKTAVAIKEKAETIVKNVVSTVNENIKAVASAVKTAANKIGNVALAGINAVDKFAKEHPILVGALTAAADIALSFIPGGPLVKAGIGAVKGVIKSYASAAIKGEPFTWADAAGAAMGGAVGGVLGAVLGPAGEKIGGEIIGGAVGKVAGSVAASMVSGAVSGATSKIITGDIEMIAGNKTGEDVIKDTGRGVLLGLVKGTVSAFGPAGQVAATVIGFIF